jgi:hypothetical protein
VKRLWTDIIVQHLHLESSSLGPISNFSTDLIQGFTYFNIGAVRSFIGRSISHPAASAARAIRKARVVAKQNSNSSITWQLTAPRGLAWMVPKGISWSAFFASECRTQRSCDRDYPVCKACRRTRQVYLGLLPRCRSVRAQWVTICKGSPSTKN